MISTFVVSVVVSVTVSMATVWLYLDHVRPWLVTKGVVPRAE